MTFTFERTIDIPEYIIQEIVEKVYYKKVNIWDAIENAFAGLDDDVYYNREFFDDAIFEEVTKRLKNFKPKTKLVRICGTLEIPARNKEDIEEMLEDDEIDFNNLVDVEILDITD